MPTYGSGLSAQLMLKAESTVGTAVTPDTGYEFLSEDVRYTPTWLEGVGLQAGQPFKRITRAAITRHNVEGGFVLEHLDQGHFGLLWRHCLGSATSSATNIATTAYKQIHTPGSKQALGMTVQFGRPQTDATVRAFTYNGCKITDWEFSVSDNQYAQLKVTLDGWNESVATGLAAASYTSAASPFTFADAGTFTLGGTPSTSAGETTVSGGVAVASIVRGITIKGSTPVAGERYGLGNAGVKAAQIENDIQTITVSLDTEFTSRTEMYDLMKAATTSTMVLNLSHGDAGSANPYLLSFIIPALKIKDAVQNVNGPDILASKVQFEAYYNGTDPVIQVKLVSKDTTL